MSPLLLKRIGHGIRWVLEMALIWTLVLSEAGPWTCTVLTIMTVGIEFDHLNPADWSKL